MVSLRDIASIYLRYPAWPLLVYGFSAGMPLKVLLAVIALYLNELGFDLTTITLFALLGLFYSLKFLWSPALDNPPFANLISRFGKRRSMLLLLHTLLPLFFLAVGIIDPIRHWPVFVACLAVIAFLGATADIVIDALRIEMAGKEQQGALSANYLIGYRIGLIAGINVPLLCAANSSWFWGFAAVALMFTPALLTTLFVTEPKHRQDERGSRSGWIAELALSLKEALADFVLRYRGALVSIIALALLYRFCDTLLGVVAYPFYADVGYSKEQIGLYSGGVGVVTTLAGGMIGGYFLMMVRWRSLMMAGLALAAVSNFAYVALAYYGDGEFVELLVVTIIADNLAGGMATTIFIAWLSSLVNLHFTAIQYALLGSLSTLVGKVAGAGSGWFIDTTHGWLLSAKAPAAPPPDEPSMTAYAIFFAVTALAALPAMWLIGRLPDHIIEPSRKS